MVSQSLFGQSAGEEWLLGVVDILQSTTPEQGVLASIIEVIVESCDEGVVVKTHGGAEAVAGIVQTVTDREIVGGEIAENSAGSSST